MVVKKGVYGMVPSKNIVVCILLSLITCGLYEIYWFITLVNDLNYVSGDDRASSGGIVFLLSLITCGIYGIYWAYKAGEKVDWIRQRRGILSSSTGILYLLLWFFGLGIVVLALAQSEINDAVQGRL